MSSVRTSTQTYQSIVKDAPGSKTSETDAGVQEKSTMSIRKITPYITTFSTTFDRFNLVRFGMRGTLVQLRTGSLAIFSPVALTPEVRSTISYTGSGRVKYIIAPDIEHHIHLGAWAKAFPEAKVIGVEGLEEKRASQKGVDKIKFDYVFGEKGQTADSVIALMPEEFRSEFKVEYFPTHINKELAFLHIPDGGSLIEADLLFNHPPREQYSKSPIGHSQGILTKIFHLFTTIHGSGQRHFLWWLAAPKDHAVFAQSAKKVSREWEFVRVIPAHGDVLEKDGKKTWDWVMKWFLDMPESKASEARRKLH